MLKFVSLTSYSFYDFVVVFFFFHSLALSIFACTVQLPYTYYTADLGNLVLLVIKGNHTNRLNDLIYLCKIGTHK